jgi:hypothetical protein
MMKGEPCGRFGSYQPQQALRSLGAGLGVVAVKPVQASARVGVKHGKGRLFLRHVLEHGEQDSVFKYVGMVASVKGVSVTEHSL